MTAASSVTAMAMGASKELNGVSNLLVVKLWIGPGTVAILLVRSRLLRLEDRDGMVKGGKPCEGRTDRYCNLKSGQNEAMWEIRSLDNLNHVTKQKDCGQEGSRTLSKRAALCCSITSV